MRNTLLKLYEITLQHRKGYIYIFE